MKVTDTIAAISTAPGSSGIGVIRMSGQDAFLIADKVFKSNKNIKLADADSHTVLFGRVVEDGKDIDQVLALVFRCPNSFTGENTVEFDCHGGMLVLKKVLDAVIKAGARSAEPGEFTKRAFLNGKMDLSQAEAVMELINAKNDFAHSSALAQLKGSVSDKIRDLRKDILYHIAFIESALDDPEHISLDGYKDEISEMLSDNVDEVTRLIDSFDNGRVIKEGIKTVILGKPNAGKSSLLNLLLGEERAIVTDIEGTTRDTLEEYINFNGLSLNIVDTAGIRESDDKVEKIGVMKAKDMAAGADLVIFVVDGAKELDDNDKEIIEIIKDKQAIVLVNKTDIETRVNIDEIKALSGLDVIMFSAKEGTGLGQLEDEIRTRFYEGKVTFNDQVYITNARHKESLDNALKSLKKVEETVSKDLPEDFYSIDLMDAYEQLGLVIGESVEDDLADEIFSKFCMGK